MERQVALWVNGKSVPLNDFVVNFIDHTLSGMLAALKDTGEMKNLELVIEGDRVNIKLNGVKVPLNYFVNGVFKGMIEGMVANMKGIGEINRVELHLKK